MRMALGSFRFLVPSFSIDKTEEKVSGRVARQAVVGATPITHLLGPDTDTLSWSSTFFPLHMNKGGPALLAGLQEATRLQTPLPMMNVQGLTGFPLGRWIITEVGATRDRFVAGGSAQVIEVSLSLERYTSQGSSSGGLLGILQ